MKTLAIFWLTLTVSSLARAPMHEMMDAWLKKQAFEALDRRQAEFEALTDAKSLQNWQNERKAAFIRAIGGFPQKTALNAKITGTRNFGDYRIEKLYFESQPGLHVTATLYLPAGKGPFPAVLHPTGHSASAKNRDLYQSASIVIAKGGCAVLCYDPIGQGERRQVFKADGTPFATTQEHMLINQGAVLLGSNTAQTMIWDGMRAIDYLQSRPDIIAEKIGCTGISGGGTNTSYLMALDERIVAAAPGCYLTGFRSLLETIGVQDAEQNIHGQLAFGMDHADYVVMRLPKPTLIMAATEDYFAIDGARDVYRQARSFAEKLGSPDCVEIAEIEGKHGFPPEMQLAAANFFRRALLGIDEPMAMPEVTTLPEEELNATPTGRVLDLPGARSIFEVRAESAPPAKSRAAVDLAKVRQLIGARKPGQLSPDFTGLSVILPGPPKGAGEPKFAIYAHGGGNPEAAKKLSRFAKRGVQVMLVELRGFGKTRPKSTGRHFDDLVGPDWRQTTMASLLGKTYVGMRTEDLWRCVLKLREITGKPDLRPDLIAVGEAGIPALHAAALEPEMFGKVSVTETLQSWRDVLSTPVTRLQQAGLVYGALPHYDLPDLATLLGERLTQIRPIRADGALTPPPSANHAAGSRAGAATGHPLATQAALDVLRRNGNAVDAAVAAGLTLGVVDGHNSGIGGGCFMLARNPEGEIFAFDGREMAPAAATRDMFVGDDGKADAQASKTGPLASGIPGSLAVYDHVLREFGRLSLAECLEAGIAIAERGFPVDSAWERRASGNRAHFEKFGEAARVFLPHGEPLEAGEVLRQPDLAATYRAIARDGISHFYGGPFAEKTAAWMSENGGIITVQDFANYKLRQREPVRSTYRGYEIVGMPPPSSGGVHVAQILNILGNFDVAGMDETDRAHLLIEAMKLAFADRAHWLGDADFARVPKSLASADYAAELAQRINLSLAAEVPGYSTPPGVDLVFEGPKGRQGPKGGDLRLKTENLKLPPEKHTTHFTVADSEGWWVACTATVNTSFGSKVVIPGTGVILNNQMDDFSIQPGVPNAFGLVGAEANTIEPGKRPLSSMSPTIVLKNGEPVLTLGAAGGPTIITQVVQAIHRFIDLDLPLEACLGNPRVHQQWSPPHVGIEDGFAVDVTEALRERGHEVKTGGTGTSQAIRRLPNGDFEAVADPRREGRADALH